MTVAELIAKLQKVTDQSMTVEIETEDIDCHLNRSNVYGVRIVNPRYNYGVPLVLLTSEYVSADRAL